MRGYKFLLIEIYIFLTQYLMEYKYVKKNKTRENKSKEAQAIDDYYAGKPDALEKGFGVLGKFAQMAMDLGKGNGKNGQEAAKIIMM